jgi:soluble cytochrome b562
LAIHRLELLFETKSNGQMKLITAAFCATLVMTGNVAFGQIGETLQQCIAKYGPVVEKPAREWHKFESKPYHLEIHFYKANADAVQYLNWVDRQKAFNKGEIETLLKQCSTAHWEVVDDSPESTMFVVKGFTAIHMKLDHILIVATDGYLERGLAAKAAAEAGNLNWVDN